LANDTVDAMSSVGEAHLVHVPVFRRRGYD
jgi:hypothetical protein